MDVRVSGANDLQALARRLRAEGEAGKGLRKDLYRGIQRSTKAPKAQARQVAAQTLPHAGGLAALVSKAKISTRTAGGGRNVGVRVIAKGDVVRSSDRGTVRHPVFGNRAAWVTQAVPSGWFTETMQQSAPAVRREILAAMSDVAKRIARG